MNQLLRDAHFSFVFIERLGVEEAVTLIASCQDAKHAMQSFLAALAFACTRPKLRTDGRRLTIKTWKWLWKMCAESVTQASSLYSLYRHPGIWAHAESACQEDSLGSTSMCDQMKIQEDDPCLCTFMEMSLNPAEFNIRILCELHSYATARDTRISAILMIKVGEERWRRGARSRCDALVVTSHEQFAWISFGFHESDGFGYAQMGFVCLHHELSRVLELATVEWAACHGSLSCHGGPHLEFRDFGDYDGKRFRFPMLIFPRHAKQKSFDGVSHLLRQKTNVVDGQLGSDDQDEGIEVRK